jgi:hypothetical protein
LVCVSVSVSVRRSYLNCHCCAFLCCLFVLHDVSSVSFLFINTQTHKHTPHTYTYPFPPRTPGPLPLEPTKEFLLANADSLAAAARPVVKQKKPRFRYKIIWPWYLQIFAILIIVLTNHTAMLMSYHTTPYNPYHTAVYIHSHFKSLCNFLCVPTGLRIWRRECRQIDLTPASVTSIKTGNINTWRYVLLLRYLNHFAPASS